MEVIFMKHIYKEIANGLTFGMLLSMSIYLLVVIVSMFIDMTVTMGLMLEGMFLVLTAIPLNVGIISGLEMKANEEE